MASSGRASRATEARTSTAIRNGDYGIYAFDSTYGQFDHDYGAGSPDAGFYIGQCFPCHAVITDSISEWNGIGYSGTNAGGDLLVVRSMWRDNRVGIVPNSGTGEKNPPQHGTTIAGNTVYGNNNAKTAAIDIAQLAIGNGILVAGGNDNVVERNLVYDHDIVGIGVIPLPEKVINPDDPKAINFDARGNRVERQRRERQPGRRSRARDVDQRCEGRRRQLLRRQSLLDVAAGAPRAARTVRGYPFAGLRDRSRPVRGTAGRDETGRRRLQEGRAAEATEPARHAGRVPGSGAPAGSGVPMAIDVGSIATPAK